MTGSDLGPDNLTVNLLVAFLVSWVVFAPLGVWKAVEIIVWLWRHIHITITG